MNLNENCCIARIYIGESDIHDHKPLYEWIVLEARRSGLAGATVFRGAMGYGHSSRLHTSKILRLSTDLPVVIEIVDSCQQVEPFLERIKGVLGDGLATIEPVKVIHPRGSSRSE